MKNCTNLSGKSACVLVAAVLAGCSSSGGLFQGERIDYQSASKKNSTSSTLDVPPDLSQISRDNRFSIPENGSVASGMGNTGNSGGSITASSYIARSAASSTPGVSAFGEPALQSSIAPNSSQNMKIERDGSQRWLLVNQSPEVLWPKVKAFWEENGFVINQESPAAGVMETDWAENRAKIPQDFLRKTIGYVFDSLYSTGERDKFRTRLERRPDGSTEIYISHRGVEEVFVGTQKESTRWTGRANDPALEASFLSRLMVSLGATQEKAKEIANAPVVQPARASLAEKGGVTVVNVDEGFDRAWRRVGLALDRIGFTVEDRDRTKGIYFVRYIDQESDAKKDGLLSNLFSFGSKEKEAKRYRIQVKEEGNLSQVAVQNNEGGIENSATSKKMLNLLLEQLK